MANYSLPYAAQLACRDINTTIPEPPFLAGAHGIGAPGAFGAAGNGSAAGNGTGDGTGAACALSEFQPSAAVLLNMCCNTTAPGADGLGTSKANTRVHNILHAAETGGYEAAGCSWRYCNVTGEEGVKSFENCIQTQSITRSRNVQAKCFVGKNGAGRGAIVGLGANSSVNAGNPYEQNQTSGANRIQWRSGKKSKKTTVSAALLMALGVAGLVLGS